MVTPELISYINNELSQGISEQAVKSQLLEANWAPQDIDEAFVRIHYQPQKQISTQINYLLPPTVLLINSWAIYKKKWKSIIKILIFYYLLYLPTILLSLILTVAVNFLNPTNPSSILFYTPLFSAVFFAVFFSILSAIIQTLSTISLILFLSTEEEKASFKILLKKSFSLLFSFWWLTLLEGLIILGGFLIFLIPGLIFFVFFLFSHYILILENIKGTNALFISREIVRERFWGVTGRILFIAVIIFIFSFVLYYLPNVINSLLYTQSFNLHTLTNPQPQKSLIFAAVVVILDILFRNLIINPVGMIYNILLYKNARELYGKSFPTPNKKSRFLLTLPALFAALILIGFSITVIYFVIFDPLKFRSYPRFQKPSFEQIPTRFPTSTPMLQPIISAYPTGIFSPSETIFYPPITE